MINQSWFPLWLEMVGPLPKDYIVFDLETTGFNSEQDLIVEIGHCRVENLVPVERMSTLLDWSQVPDLVDQSWLKHKLQTVKRSIERPGSTKVYPFTYERLQVEGIHPLQVISAYYDIFNSAVKTGLPIVGHNAWAFDAPFVVAHFSDFINATFAVEAHQLIDTGIIEKASQLEFLPNEGESVHEFYTRTLRRFGKHIKWSLDLHCVPKYELDTRYNIDTKLCHQAGYDAYVTHLLLERFRELGVSQ